MGFLKKKSTIAVCDMCGKTEDAGCGNENRHVQQVTHDQPEWLPANWRSQAVGQYTWFCSRCNAYPDQKWPSDSGAWAAMILHLGKVHDVGRFRGPGTPVNFNMVSR
jgi:hypothetical protein